jgi:hypothetical protein
MGYPAAGVRNASVQSSFSQPCHVALAQGRDAVMSIRNSQPQRCCLAAAIIVGLAMSATVMPASAQATTDAQATPTQDAQQTADADDKKVKTLDMVEVKCEQDDDDDGR